MNAIAAVPEAVVILAIVFVPSVIRWLKGKPRWAVLGFFTGWHRIPVFRLAKPDSWWARRYYGPDQQHRAAMRFYA